MSEHDPVGAVGWVDLTVEDADRLRDFYAAVVGWRPEPTDMGGYADHTMCDPASGEARTGVCHRRGPNAAQPGGWMVYFTVADLDRSLAEVRARGGEVLGAPRGSGDRFCVVRDPSGATCALYQKAKRG